MTDSNGKSLSIMTEDEFASAPLENTQRWFYRALNSICTDVRAIKLDNKEIKRDNKEIKQEIQEIKKNRGIAQKSMTLVGGAIGGFLAQLASKATGVGQ